MKEIEIVATDKDSELVLIDTLCWSNLDELKEQVKILEDKCKLIMSKSRWHCQDGILTIDEHEIIFD